VHGAQALLQVVHLDELRGAALHAAPRTLVRLIKES